MDPLQAPPLGADHLHQGWASFWGAIPATWKKRGSPGLLPPQAQPSPSSRGQELSLGLTSCSDKAHGTEKKNKELEDEYVRNVLWRE